MPAYARFLLWRKLGLQDYLSIWEAMRQFTDARTPNTIDELWSLEHPPVYTLGQAGRIEHILDPGSTPVIRSDRGGQVTYHGPGQIIIYVLCDLRRAGIGIKTLVWKLEQAVIDCLAEYSVIATRLEGAPGLYVAGRKIASLGLRVRNARTFHGLSLNCAMNLEPFNHIHPCGYPSLKMTQLSELVDTVDINQVEINLAKHVAMQLNCELSQFS